MQEHHFKLQFSKYSADFVFGGKYTLFDLALFIVNTIGFDFDHPFEFCDNLRNPYKSKERYTLFADEGLGEGEAGVERTLVADVFRKGRKMAFHFDYGDDWLFLLTCTDVRESAAQRRFKKVIATSGKPPVQYEYEDEDNAG